MQEVIEIGHVTTFLPRNAQALYSSSITILTAALPAAAACSLDRR